MGNGIYRGRTFTPAELDRTLDAAARRLAREVERRVERWTRPSPPLVHALVIRLFGSAANAASFMDLSGSTIYRWTDVGVKVSPIRRVDWMQLLVLDQRLDIHALLKRYG